MKYLYLHGLGQTADSWDKVLEALDMPSENVCVELPGLVRGREVTYAELYAAFSRRCGAEEGELVLCGLSLGAVLALNYAIDHPGKVRALALTAAQYKMPKKLLKLQNMLFRFMPESQFRQTGFGKADFIRLCSTMAELDFEDQLHRVSCPVLLVCGEKDSANKKASEELAKRLSHASLSVLPGVGHEVNLEAPEQLAEALREFYKTLDE